jgi:hypothetical protein
MSANILGPKQIRKLREKTGLDIERALIWSHHDSGRWADCRIIHDDGTHDHILVHRETGETAPQSGTHWSTCREIGQTGNEVAKS